MAISTAVGLERISRIVGYAIKKGNFQTVTPYLPQRIAILGEANTANQSGLTVAPFEFTTAREVGIKYGYGSPLHQMARILRPVNSTGVGGIPTVIYPQISDAGATATVIKAGITGTATANVTHYIVISGRDGLDGEFYAINIALGDNAAAVEAKIIAAVNGVLGCPVTAADNSGDIDFTTKWEGVSSAEVNISYDTNGNAAGLVYAEISKTDLETFEIFSQQQLIPNGFEV
jgi:phage tail sheath gpL-like